MTSFSKRWTPRGHPTTPDSLSWEWESHYFSSPSSCLHLVFPLSQSYPTDKCQGQMGKRFLGQVSQVFRSRKLSNADVLEACQSVTGSNGFSVNF